MAMGEIFSWRFGAVSVAILAAAAPSAALAGPSFNCESANTDTERMICTDDELATLDRHVADHFAEALRAAAGLDVDADTTMEILRAEQDGWHTRRDACLATGRARSCLLETYARREAELVSGWLLEAPIAEMSYYCGGNYADEIYVLFFDTHLPSARIEYGDGVDLATLVRTASGSRYDGTFGRWIWVKGHEARLVWSDGDELQCESAE